MTMEYPSWREAFSDVQHLISDMYAGLPAPPIGAASILRAFIDEYKTAIMMSIRDEDTKYAIDLRMKLADDHSGFNDYYSLIFNSKYPTKIVDFYILNDMVTALSSLFGRFEYYVLSTIYSWVTTVRTVRSPLSITKTNEITRQIASTIEDIRGSEEYLDRYKAFASYQQDGTPLYDAYGFDRNAHRGILRVHYDVNEWRGMLDAMNDVASMRLFMSEHVLSDAATGIFMLPLARIQQAVAYFLNDGEAGRYAVTTSMFATVSYMHVTKIVNVEHTQSTNAFVYAILNDFIHILLDLVVYRALESHPIYNMEMAIPPEKQNAVLRMLVSIITSIRESREYRRGYAAVPFVKERYVLEGNRRTPDVSAIFSVRSPFIS